IHLINFIVIVNMQLSVLLKDEYSIPSQIDTAIAGLALNSREVQENTLFFAIKGHQVDGRLYIDDAIKHGAIAVLVDADTPHEPMIWRNQVPLIPIYQLAKKIGKIAALFYNNPAKS